MRTTRATGSNAPTFQTSPEVRWGTEEDEDTPFPGMLGPWALPPRCAQLCGAHTRSPVLIPRLLRSWITSWVRPGHSPALSMPVFTGDPGTLVPWASAGFFLDASQRPFLEVPRAARRREEAAAPRKARPWLGLLCPEPARPGRTAASGFQAPGPGR